MTAGAAVGTERAIRVRSVVCPHVRRWARAMEYAEAIMIKFMQSYASYFRGHTQQWFNDSCQAPRRRL